MSLGRCLRFLHRRTYAQGIAAAGLGAAAVFIARTASPACSKEGRSTLEQEGDGCGASAFACARDAALHWLSSWRPATTTKGEVATVVVGAVTELKSDKLKREAMYLLRQTPLVRWLIGAAACGSPRQEAKPHEPQGGHKARRVLADLLADGATADAILQAPGAVPLLFGHMTAEGWDGRLAEALTWAVLSGPPVKHAGTEDIKAVLQMLEPGMGWRTRRMAAAMVGAWAASSPSNCIRLAEAGAARVLSSGPTTSMGIGTVDGEREVHWEVVSLELDTWVEPLICMSADALAVDDRELACSAVEVLTSCLHSRGNHGDSARQAAAGSNALHLLEKLATSGDDPRARQAVASSLAALTAPGCKDFTAEERELWTGRLLSWMLPPSQERDLIRASAKALAGLARVEGQEGLWVAHQWLSALLVHLADHTESKAKIAGKDSRRMFPMRRPPPATPPKEQNSGQETAVWGVGSLDEPSAVGKTAVSAEAARDAAKKLVDASRAAVIVHEPPPEHEAHMSREAMLVYPELAAKVDAALAEEVTSKALTEMAILASGNRERMRWLLHAGILPLLSRLNHINAAPSGHQEAGTANLSIMQSTARIVSILVTDRSLQHWIRGGEWEEWLWAGAASADCWLSSCCTKALLNLEATSAESVATKSLDAVSEALLLLSGEVRRAGEALVLHDGVHLMDPSANHHWVLAREGTASQSPGAPLMDLLFVHGVRGNAFGTWRIFNPGHARDAVTHESIWPASWLKDAISDTRILSYEYSAPVSDREGRSLPLDDLVEATAAKWLAAGLGERPTVVVCHSLGGVLLKEVLRHFQRPGATPRERRFLDNLRGVVFYATPHFGTYLADIGWGLRNVGASPTTVIRHLKPGPHHHPCNDALRLLYGKGRLRVLSFGEMARTPLISIAPWLSRDAALKMEVVPLESAYPGFGEFVALHGVDHINACKPVTPSDVSYVRAMEFIRQRIEESKPKEVLHRDWEGFPQAD